MSNYTKGIEVELTLDGEKVIQELKTIDSRLVTIRKELGQLNGGIGQGCCRGNGEHIPMRHYPQREQRELGL